MDGQAEKIKSLVNILISYLAEFKFFPLQVLKQTEWVSGMAEDVLLSRMKNIAQKGRDTDPRDKRGTLDESQDYWIDFMMQGEKNFSWKTSQKMR